MFLHCCCGISLLCSQPATGLATSQLIKLLADLSAHIIKQRGIKDFKSQLGEKECQRRSSRGLDLRLTHEPHLGNQRLLIPSSVLEMYILPTVPTVHTVGAFSRLQLGESSALLRRSDRRDCVLSPGKAST